MQKNKQKRQTKNLQVESREKKNRRIIIIIKHIYAKK